jgi:hypothetical protein
MAWRAWAALRRPTGIKAKRKAALRQRGLSIQKVV